MREDVVTEVSRLRAQVARSGTGDVLAPAVRCLLEELARDQRRSSFRNLLMAERHRRAREHAALLLQDLEDPALA